MNGEADREFAYRAKPTKKNKIIRENHKKRIGDEMTTEDKELFKKIDEVSAKFVGQLDDLQAAVGMVVVGRLYGWRVIRLISSKRQWKFTCSLFGDLKEILPERPELSQKSVGLAIVDKAGDYWDVIKGNASRDHLPLHERKKVA